MLETCQTLTEKEKQTLRLMGRGHDAKSMARHLGLSVHTVNERLRAARQKMSVSSSREAARLLLDTERDTPNSLGDKLLGEARPLPFAAQDVAAIDNEERARRPLWVVAGVVMMLFVLGISAALLQPQSASRSADSTAQTAQAEADIVRSARDWLAMVDAGRWEDSYRATSGSFRSLNTVEVWTNVSEHVRVPLGAMVSRADLSQDWVPAPPHGYRLVKFRTSFANRPNVTETLTLVREGQAWRVSGYTID